MANREHYIESILEDLWGQGDEGEYFQGFSGSLNPADHLQNFLAPGVLEAWAIDEGYYSESPFKFEIRGDDARGDRKLYGGGAVKYDEGWEYPYYREIDRSEEDVLQKFTNQFIRMLTPYDISKEQKGRIATTAKIKQEFEDAVPQKATRRDYFTGELPGNDPYLKILQNNANRLLLTERVNAQKARRNWREQLYNELSAMSMSAAEGAPGAFDYGGYSETGFASYEDEIRNAVEGMSEEDYAFWYSDNPNLF